MFKNISLTRQVLERHSHTMRQFIDFRQTTLPNSTGIIEATNSSGLSFTILPDRGLDIWTAAYNGLPLTWISQGAPYAPDFGQSWLEQFNGGLLVTCGLTHVGPPEVDSITGERRDIHGKYSRLRALHVGVRTLGWDGDRYTLELSGVLAEVGWFPQQLRLERTYSMTLGAPRIDISDRVTNVGDTLTPLMVLYHFNFGYPVIAAGTELHTPYESVRPRDDPARAGYDGWPVYEAPQALYAEQVFFHHVKRTANDPTVPAALIRGDGGLLLEWNSDELPYLTQWKNIRQGGYVCGVEPGNCIPEGQNAARASGRLRLLAPGESQTFSCALSVLPDANAVSAARARIDSLRMGGVPVRGVSLDDYPLP